MKVACYGVPEKSVDFWGVFGNRNGSNVNNVQNNGNYWSATPNDSANAWNLNFNSSEVYMGSYSRCLGRSVRLVL